MTWIFYALLSRFFMAATTIIDQFVAHKFGHRRTVAAVVLQNMASLITLIGIVLLYGIPTGGQPDMIWMNIGVIANVACLFPYMKALEKDDARNVIPMAQFMPAILVAMAVFFEPLQPLALVVSIIMIACGFLFAWDFSNGKFNAKTAGLMVVTGALYAAFYMALRQTGAGDPIAALWHFNIGFFVASIAMTFIFPRAIGSIKAAIASTRGRIILFELGSGILNQGAVTAVLLALASAPGIMHFAALSAIQPVFALGIAVAAGMLVPALRPQAAATGNTIIKLFILAILIGCAFILI